MRGLPEIIEALSIVPVRGVRATLARIVPLGDLARNSPPEFLFTSGRPNRYNPAGIECVYFSEDDATARLEYARQWAGLRAGKQPVVTYFAEVRLRRVLDLTSARTMEVLELKPRDLHQPWRTAASPTATQRLGKAVCDHSLIAAIRYPSDAAKEAGVAGCNMVVFRDRIKSPDSVRILGPTRKPLGRWR